MKRRTLFHFDDGWLRRCRLCGWFGAWLAVLALWPSQPSRGDDRGLEFFEKEVRPLLVEHCYSCHSHRAEKLKGGLYVDSRKGLLHGGESGPALDEGEPARSLLLEAIRYESLTMPPEGKLADHDIKKFEKWVEMGAPWPEEQEPDGEAKKPVFDIEERRASHWMWQPMRESSLVASSPSNAPSHPLDAYIDAKLTEAGIEPAPPVDRASLLRRLSFDLVGLPPTIEESQRFLDDPTPQSIESAVDRLLESPAFGERWGRHWLDLVRYAESRGHEFDYDATNAYQYRDYVIRALNEDVPYDRFVCEQIAGDLLASPRLHPQEGFNESILGTGFWFLGEWVHSPVDIRKDETDRFDNMIDVFSKTFLGVTIGCARCHDHKFDAISSRDYYALSGFLQSSDYRQVRFETIQTEKRIAGELAAIDEQHRSRLRPILVEMLSEAVEVSEDVPADRESSNEASVDRESSATNLFPAPPTGGTRTLVDYADLPSDGWMQDGVIFGLRPVRSGTILLASSNDQPAMELATRSAASNDSFWDPIENVSGPAANEAGLHENLKAGRTLRSPTVPLKTGEVYVCLRGSGLLFACVDSHRQLHGPLHRETLIKLTSAAKEGALEEPIRWIPMKLERYAGHRIHFEFTPEVGSKLEIFQIVEKDSSESQTNDLQAPGFATGRPVDDSAVGSPKEAVDGSQDRILKTADMRQVIRAWASDELAQDGEAMQALPRLNSLLQKTIRSRSSDDRLLGDYLRVIADWRAARAKLQSSVRWSSHLAMAMMDGSSEDDSVLIRGSSSNPGEPVARRFLEAIDGSNPLTRQTRSGRLELAERIVDPANPLTFRVIVNRVWHHLLGRGIVPTTDDFGVLGQPPTHPELLDHLALRFLREGQSIKRLIRYIVLSKTYQRSGNTPSDSLARDPNNRWWHSVPPKRLQGETLRDALLALGGNLDARMYGPSIPVHLTPFMDGRGRPKKSGPEDGDRRRSIYLAVRRNFLSPMMSAFDSPTPFSTMGRRNVSNVPAQALILMNDPFIAKQASLIAHRLIAEVPSDSVARIRWLYRAFFAREPLAEEFRQIEGYLEEESQGREMAIDAPELWADIAHALINTKEFIFIR